MRPFSTSTEGSRGFTLLELGITVGILALAVLVVVPSMEAAFGVKTREHAAKVGGTIRAMYSEAVLSGRTCRLVFDLEQHAYWPECAEGRVRIAEKEDSLRGQRLDVVEKIVRGTEEQEAARAEVESRNAFSDFESGLAPRVAFSGDVHFGSVWTQHQTEPYTAGTAYLYFFPNGQTERAYIHVTDGADTYTIIVNPMTGRTRVVPDKVDVPDKERR